MTTPTTEKVWDPLVRLFHWSLVLGFAVAYLTEDELMPLHLAAGYLVLGLVAFRTAWGFVGTRHARFSDFVRPPRSVLAYLGDLARLRAPRHLGHSPAGGAMVLALLLVLLLTGLSGLALQGVEAHSGPLAGLLADAPRGWVDALEELHEVLAHFTLALVLAHLAGVLLASLQHGENLVRSMITGYKRRSP